LTIYIISGLIIIALVYTLATYNTLVRRRNAVMEAFSTMDVYLKKRWDLIPNLVEVVKGYAAHERAALENVVTLRNAAYDNMSANEKIDANDRLSAGLPGLIALAESYPDLKASENFSDLSARLTSVENDIANARKYYNAVVKSLNTAVEVFPGSIVAKLFNFKRERFFMIREEDREAVKVDLR